MKLTKTLMSVAMAGTMAFAASKVQAVPGQVSISGKVYVQAFNNNDVAVTKTYSINTKKVLQMLAIATGEPSLTNKPTKFYYDPDVFNETAYFSNQGAFNVEGGLDFYGEFYVSNVVVGVMYLDNTDISGNYYSYIELDSFSLNNDFIDEVLGPVNSYATEYNQIVTGSNNGNKISTTGSGLLYVHSSPFYYGLMGTTDGGYSQQYFANEFYGTYNDYALSIRGLMTFNGSINSNNTKAQESVKLTGSGDGMWTTSDNGTFPVVVSGKFSFSGKGPSNF